MIKGNWRRGKKKRRFPTYLAVDAHCRFHPFEPEHFYCVSCKAFACAKCGSKRHKGHYTVPRSRYGKIQIIRQKPADPPIVAPTLRSALQQFILDPPRVQPNNDNDSSDHAASNIWEELDLSSDQPLGIGVQLSELSLQEEKKKEIQRVTDPPPIKPEILKDLGGQLDLRLKVVDRLDYLKTKGVIDERSYRQTLAEFDSKSNVICGDTNYVQSNINNSINPIGAYE